MGLRIKITDAMLEAAMDELVRQVVLDGHSFPDEEADPEFWRKSREVMRDILQAAADAAQGR